MQKLIFKNGNGKEIDLTAGNYGITNWSGLSNTGLNIQTQQVPFADGGVYLDALMNQREITVTVAIQDNNNLELRYQLKRDLISALNPKGGEGVLIYQNDYLARQIHAVPQLPIFENKNSNTSGTLKASVTFSCPDPYWEDLEEKIVNIKQGVRTSIENKGDVKTNLKIELFPDILNTPKIENFTERKLIKINGIQNKPIIINTNVGEKTINTAEIKFNISSIGEDLNYVFYEKHKKIYIILGNNGLSLTSNDLSILNIGNSHTSSNLMSATYSEDLDLFVAVGNDGTIITSQDGIDWTLITSNITANLLSITYSEYLGLFVAVGENGTIITSQDGIDWIDRTGIVNLKLNSVIYDDYLNLFVAVGNTGTIITSQDGITWAQIQNINQNYNLTSVAFSENEIVAVCDSYVYRSVNGLDWIGKSSDVGKIVNYSKERKLFISIGKTFSTVTFRVSIDGSSWSKVETNLNEYNGLYIDDINGVIITVYNNGQIAITNDIYNEWKFIKQSIYYDAEIKSIAYSQKLGILVAVGDGYNSRTYCITSNDGINWTLRYLIPYPMVASYNVIKYIDELELFITVGSYGESAVSTDGINWTRVMGLNVANFVSIVYSKIRGKVYTINAGGYIYSSVDGYNWEPERNTNCPANDMIFVGDNDAMYIIGRDGMLHYSSNLITWYAFNSPVETALNSIIYVERLKNYLIVGDNGVILLGWSPVDTQIIDSGVTANLIKIVDAEELGIFITCDDGKILHSYNGKNWEKMYGSNTGLNSLIYYKNSVIVVGKNSVILQYYNQIKNNIINSLSSDSDMSLGLEQGVNELLLTSLNGTVTGKLTFRQRYVGV